MVLDNWSLLSRLRRAVKKIKFLLSFNTNRWRLASMISASSSNRRLSFNDRPGLRACMDDSAETNDSSSSPGIRRSTSSSSEDDIDKRAELFITNFYRQLQLERQISLELRYARGLSFGSTSP